MVFHLREIDVAGLGSGKVRDLPFDPDVGKGALEEVLDLVCQLRNGENVGLGHGIAE
jgi:hypothetical protein